ncbi:MAG: pitrilysin family protein [Melioribacteraceae bacterium]
MKLKLFLVLFIAGSVLYGQTRKIEFTQYDMDNGIHVILHKDNSTPIVAITMTFHVGSKNEDPTRTGFAHFFEHLMFEGSKYMARGDYDKLSQNAGGENNASTSFDKTFYYQVLPSNQLELGLWMESERLDHLKIDSIGVETQRKVVKEERSQRYDNQPYGSIFEQTFKRAYKVHPYKWMPIGSAQYIDQATLAEFMAFYKKFYVPQNVTISVAGDIDLAKTKELVAKYFAEIPRGKEDIKKVDVVEPPLGGEVRDVVYDNIQLPLVLEAYRIPAQGTKDYYAIEMLSTLLSKGQSSRLYKEIVDKQQKALFLSSMNYAMEDPGLFVVYGITNMGVTPEDLEAVIETELTKVKDKIIDEQEFQKLRNQIESDFVNSNSTMIGIANSLADYYVYFGDANLINTEIDRYMKVTKEDIRDAAKKYLTPENRVVLYYLPKSAEKK